MEVFLYNSTVCRLCGEENDNGTFLYSSDENNQTLNDVINKYLPVKVSDDGQLPRTICPGCTIQLEATVEFLNLIINGQKVLRELHQREKIYKKSLTQETSEPDEEIVIEINTSNGVYHVDHVVALEMAGLDKPKRKRGRPPKKPKSPEDIAQEDAARQKEIEEKKEVRDEEVSGKRQRKAPTRFKEVVQGKELERILKEEGVTDDEDSDTDKKLALMKTKPAVSKEPEIIGHMEVSGELVAVVKGKGRGRPKGRTAPTREECAICGMTFSCVGRYMSHIAQHGPVEYQCGGCAKTFGTRLLFQTHQQDSGHKGRNVILSQSSDKPKETVDTLALPETATVLGKQEVLSLPDLSEKREPEVSATEFINDLEVKNVNVISDLPNIKNSIVDLLKDDENDGDKSEEVIEVGPKGKVKLKCGQCDKTFSSKQSKSMHIKAVHKGERPYTCTVCGLKFPYPRSLALHTISHRRQQRSQNRRYACDLCGKVLNHPSSVVYHKEAEHAGQKYVCNKCGKQFKHKQLLQRHQLVHSQVRPYSCKLCNATFKTKANLLNHQSLHSGVKKFSCNICNHKFAHKTSLTLHMRWHTGSKPYTCTICNKSFSQKGNLSEHERIHTGEKPFLCDLCPRRFTTSSQARLHARRHQPDRPFACPHCPKRFVSRGSWLAHRKREEGARSHACNICGRAFTERWALLKHTRKHTGERPFRCPYCPRAFADCSNLNKHKKQIHKQMSLLVNDKSQKPTVPEDQPSQIATNTKPQLILSNEQLMVQQAMKQDELIAVTNSPNDGDESVIYVTYGDMEEPEPAFHLLNPVQCEFRQPAIGELYSAPSLLVSQSELGMGSDTPTQEHTASSIMELPGSIEMSEPIEIDSDMEEQIAVTDEAGNPLHFTMQDGTELAIMSVDGKTLQVVTHDGKTIPVEINGFNGDEIHEIEEDDPEIDTDSLVHQISLQKEDSTVSSNNVTYYTLM